MALISKTIEGMLITPQLFGFLGSTAQDRIKDTSSQLVQTQTYPGFLEVTLAFIPLNFCTSVCYLLSTI